MADKPLKITIVGPAPNPHTQRFADHFIKSGCELKVVSFLPGEVEGAEVYVHSQIPEESSGLKKKWETLKDYVEVRKRLEWADIVFVNFIYRWRFNLVYKGLKNVVVLIWGSDILYQEDETPDELKYRKLILSIAARVLAFSDFLAKAAKKYMPEGKEIEVLHVGVKLDEFYPGGRVLGELDPVVIGFAKSLEKKYGPEILLKACHYLKEDEMNFRCKIAGSGDQEVPLKIMADRLGLNDNVEFLGRLHHDQMPEFMRGIDIFCMPSTCEESFGIAALEASATEVPVVASRKGGIEEAVWDDETGILVEADNPMALAIGLRSLVMSPDLRACMGKQGRAYARFNYPWEKTVERLDEIFDGIAGNTSK